MDFERRKRPFRHLGRIIDIINIVLSIVVITSALFIAIDRAENMLLFPVIFLCTSLINLALAIKFYKRNERMKALTLVLGFLLFVGIGAYSLVVVL